jgi:hypothetical protein
MSVQFLVTTGALCILSNYVLASAHSLPENQEETCDPEDVDASQLEVDPCQEVVDSLWSWTSNSPIFSPTKPTSTEANKSFTFLKVII